MKNNNTSLITRQISHRDITTSNKTHSVNIIFSLTISTRLLLDKSNNTCISLGGFDFKTILILLYTVEHCKHISFVYKIKLKS